MKAIVLQQPQQMELVDLAEPQDPGPGEALVKVHRVGICGTDISGYLGKFPFYSYPRIPGHELGVEVLAVGEEVTEVDPGDWCCVEPYINDPSSFASQRGRGNCCNRLQVLGVHTDGGLRERFVLPARKLHRATHMTWEQLALVETLAIGCHAVDRADPQGDDHILIIGAGPIGLSVLEFARLTPARITVMDMNDGRLEFCRRQMKIESTVLCQSDGSHVDELKRLTNGNLFTIVIDATGNAASMSQALEFVAHTGRLVFVGITTQEIHFLHPLMHAREMTLLASRNALPDDFVRIIRLIEQGVIDTRPWITHHSSLSSLPADFPSFTKPETGVIKAVVHVP